jgi:hypothetical protein
MIRFLFRSLGLLCLAAAFILVVYDGTKSIAADQLYFTSVQGIWQLLNPDSFERFTATVRPMVTPYAGGMAWDPIILGILSAPAWSLPGVLGVLFLLLGRKKKPLIGYAR